MEAAYITRITVRRKNNVIDLEEYRRRREWAWEDPAEEEPEELPVSEPRPSRLLERSMCVMDMLASAALTFCAFVGMCVALFVLL